MRYVMLKGGTSVNAHVYNVFATGIVQQQEQASICLNSIPLYRRIRITKENELVAATYDVCCRIDALRSENWALAWRKRVSHFSHPAKAKFQNSNRMISEDRKEVRLLKSPNKGFEIASCPIRWTHRDFRKHYS